MFKEIVKFLKRFFGIIKCEWEIVLYDKDNNPIAHIPYNLSCNQNDIIMQATTLMFRNPKADSFSVHFVSEE